MIVEVTMVGALVYGVQYSTGMHRIVVLLLVASLPACNPRDWKIANTASLAVTEASLACDWRQTHQSAASNWADGASEGNPMLGLKPSTTTVDLWFAGWAIGLVAARLLPEKWQPFVYGAFTAMEVKTIVGNLPATGGCL